MTLKVFTQSSCPKCPAAHALIKQLSITNYELKIEEYDVTTADGLAEASFYSVMATPSLILLDDAGKEIHTWRGETPSLENLKVKMQNDRQK